jgi:hypothetical protein
MMMMMMMEGSFELGNKRLGSVKAGNHWPHKRLPVSQGSLLATFVPSMTMYKWKRNSGN